MICTLHWCKQGTGRDVAPNLRIIPWTALYGAARSWVIFGSVLCGTLSAPTKFKPCVSAESVPSRTDPQKSRFVQRRIVPSIKIGEGLGVPHARCLVCSSARCISKGSCGEGEPKTVQPVSVQRAYLTGLTRKNPASCSAVNENWRQFGATSRPVLCLHQCKVHIKRKLWGRRA